MNILRELYVKFVERENFFKPVWFIWALSKWKHNAFKHDDYLETKDGLKLNYNGFPMWLEIMLFSKRACEVSGQEYKIV